MDKISLVGHEFGELLVLDFFGKQNHESTWLCSCSCGGEAIVRRGNLLGGNTKSCGCSRKKLPDGEALFREIYAKYKRNATKRGRRFTLSMDETKALMKKNCNYCGAEPSNRAARGGQTPFIYNGLDRYDNRSGYVIDNVVPCCSKCNVSKRHYTVEEFLGWIELVYHHNVEPQSPQKK